MLVSFYLVLQCNAQRLNKQKHVPVSNQASLSNNSSGTATPPRTAFATDPPRPRNSASVRRNPSRTSPAANSVTTTVKVFARRGGISAEREVGRDEVLASAGTYGDFTRYLQAMPGVTWNNDFSNELWVRGGNPAENLFVVDGIEIPNINHFALEGTTGGFVSMLDSSLIEDVTLKPGNYDSSYSRRLSSLVDIRTRKMPKSGGGGQMDVGIEGAGGFLQRHLASRADLMLAAHRSLLNLATNDIGINGVPIYTNGFAKSDWNPRARDHIVFLDLSGADSVRMTPQPCDPGVSSPIRTDYGGLRSTTGFLWEHDPSGKSQSVVQGSYSFQNQDIGQNWQMNISPRPSKCVVESQLVYQDATRDRIGSVSYRATLQRAGWLYSFGGEGQTLNFNYQVAQPVGQQSPFNPNPSWSDTDSFTRKPTVGQFAQFAEARGTLANRLTLTLGAREEEFGLTGVHTFNPRASLAFRFSRHQSVDASFDQSSQLPPTINILSYAQNYRLAPIHATQFSLGADFWSSSRITVSMQAYTKQYSDEPVSTEYPSLMLANLVDTLGQQFVWLPLKSTGRGRADGLEFLVRAHTASRFRALGSFTWSKTVYAAADGIMRAGNFDLPIVANVTTALKLFHGIDFSARNSFATGRPYTPFNIPLSEAQHRGIYNLSQINGVRAPAYNRLDFALNRDLHMGNRLLNIHIGVENALNRRNFLGYVWLDSCPYKSTTTTCGGQQLAVQGVPELMVYQMHIFPDAAVRYDF